MSSIVHGLVTGAPLGSSVTQLLETRKEASPDAPAVDDGVTCITYAELHARANRLGHHLRSLGIGREDLVGVAQPRTTEMVVTVLGILKAGAAYVPFDPAYPAERLAFMIADSGVRALVGPKDILDELPIGDVATVYLDAEAKAIASRPLTPVPVASEADDAMYVLYTSGSTGRPKGVVVTHRSVVRLVEWGARELSADDLAIVAGSTSLSFDLSVFELFVTLCLGGMVRILTHALALVDLDDSSGITLVNTVPSLLNELLQLGGVPRSVRTLTVAGEPLPADVARRAYGHTAVKRIINLYGPTETTVWVTGHDVHRGDTGLLPIGRPLPNASIYVLDDRRQPVARGEVGEIWVGGDWLARGYLGRPELTSELFATCPFTNEARARMYRTGDLGRIRADGLIETLGRLDDQVKVRGYRVELGEIEAVLSEHPGVKGAVVRASVPHGEPARLVAYTVPTGAPVEPPELRRLARATLPEYMVPSAYVSIPSFPRTPNGKIDTRALPQPDWAQSRIGSVRVAPKGSCDERAVAQLCRDLLHLERPVGVHEDFFDDLGGTSLQAIHLLVQIERRFGTSLPATTLLRDTTVGGIAAAVRADGRQGPSNLTINPEGRRDPLFLVHGWVGGVLQYRGLRPYIDPDQPVIGIHPQGLSLHRSLEATIEGMASRAIVLLRKAKARGPYLIGGHSIGGLIAYEMGRQLREQGDPAALVLLLDAAVPLHGLSLVRQKVRWYRRAFRDRALEERAAHARRVIDYRLGRPIRRVLMRTPAEVDDHSLWDPVARNDEANYRAMGRFVARPYEGRVVVGRTADWTMKTGRSDLGWTELVSGDLQIELLPGSHLTMFDEPGVAAVASFITAALEVNPR